MPYLLRSNVYPLYHIHAASKAPSYLNRQPYAFLIRENDLILLRMPDAYTDEHSFRLDLGIVLLHFTAAAEQWTGKIHWDFESRVDLNLPAGCTAEAVYHM